MNFVSEDTSSGSVCVFLCIRTALQQLMNSVKGGEEADWDNNHFFCTTNKTLAMNSHLQTVCTSCKKHQTVLTSVKSALSEEEALQLLYRARTSLRDRTFTAQWGMITSSLSVYDFIVLDLSDSWRWTSDLIKNKNQVGVKCLYPGRHTAVWKPRWSQSLNPKTPADAFPPHSALWVSEPFQNRLSAVVQTKRD